MGRKKQTEEEKTAKEKAKAEAKAAKEKAKAEAKAARAKAKEEADAAKAKRKDKLKDEYADRKREFQRTQNSDLIILSLQEKKLKADDAIKLWGGDNRDKADYLQWFLKYNKETLVFLGVDYSMSTEESAILFNASQLVGCAPLISPVTGKQCGNLIVKSEYQDDIDGIIPLIKGGIDLKYKKDAPLNKSPLVSPPMYLECIRYIEAYIIAEKTHWKKFCNLRLEQTVPASSTDWTLYATRSYDPQVALRYPNRLNRLVTDHPEWLELTYVLTLALAEVQSSRAPKSLKLNYNEKIARLKQSVPYHKLKPVREVKIHRSDPHVIQDLKGIANNILTSQSSMSCAWSFNITKFFERYVQFILEQVILKVGGRVHSNYHFPILGNRPNWCLYYLEPDIILSFRNKTVIVDAKYKSHMMNLFSNTEILRSSFRHDLHQVMGYSALSGTDEKEIMFCYPSTHILHREIYVQNPINGIREKVLLIGFPIDKDSIPEIVDYVYHLINE